MAVITIEGTSEKEKSARKMSAWEMRFGATLKRFSKTDESEGQTEKAETGAAAEPEAVEKPETEKKPAKENVASPAADGEPKPGEENITNTVPDSMMNANSIDAAEPEEETQFGWAMQKRNEIASQGGGPLYMTQMAGETEEPQKSRGASRRNVDMDVILSSPYFREPDPEAAREYEERRQKRARQGWSRLVDIFSRQSEWLKDPEREARRLWDAHRGGVPLYMMDDPEAAKIAGARRQMRDDFPIYKNLSDSTLRWLQVSRNLRIARDDAKQLDEMNKALTRLAIEIAPESNWNLSRLFRAGWANLARGFSEANRYEADIYGRFSNYLGEVFGGVAEKLGVKNKSILLPMLLTNSYLLGLASTVKFKPYIDKYEEGFWQRRAESWDPGEYLLPENTAARLAHDVALSLPYQIASGAQFLAIAALTKSKTLANIAGVVGEASVEAGGVYSEALARGMSVEEARKAADSAFIKNVAILSVTEPIQNMLNFGGGAISKRLLGRFAGSRWFSWLARFGELGVSAGFEGIEEGAQGVAKSTSLGDQIDWDGVMWESFVGFGAGLFGGVSGRAMQYGLARTVDRAAKVDRAKAVSETVDNVVDAIAESKTVARIPDAGEDFIRDVTEGKIDKVYIDGEALSEFAQIADAASVDALMRELGVPEEQLEDFRQTLETGGDIEVDAVKLLGKMGTDEEVKKKYPDLKDHIKFNPTDMSAAEAKALDERLREEAVPLVEAWYKEAERAEKAGGAAATFAKDVRKQFAKAGRADILGKGGAKGEAAMNLYIARAIRKASDLGIEIEELLKPGVVNVQTEPDGNVKILFQREGDVTPITLAQTSWHGGATRGIERMSTKFIGTGEGAQAYGWGIYSAQQQNTGETYRKKESAKRGLETGQLYRLEVPESDVLLDWDKRLSEQPENVRKQILTLYDEIEADDSLREKFADTYELLEKALNPKRSVKSDPTGDDIYNSIDYDLGSDEAASKYLNSLGIPGLQYLDQLSRTDGEGIHNFVVWDEGAMEIMETYYQGVNRDVNIDEKIAVIETERAFAEGTPVWEARKEFPREVRDAVLAEFSNGGIVNVDTNWRLTLSSKNFSHLLNTRSRDREIDITHFEVISALPEIARRGKLIESYDDQKGIRQIKKMHRLFAPVQVGSDVHSVRILVKEYQPGVFEIDDNADNPITVKKIYDHTVERNISAGTSEGDELDARDPRPTADSEYTIRQLLEGVNDADGKPYIDSDGTVNWNLSEYGGFGQDEDIIRRGSTAFGKDAAVITLFEKANQSTLLHELGHLFLQDVFDTAMDRRAATGARELWQGVAKWLDVEDIDLSKRLSEEDTRRWTTAHEKFAVAFEHYLYEGKAPTAALTKAFRAFKKWLMDLYNTVKNILYKDADGKWRELEIDDEIRGLFDRMLATDEAIEYEAATNDLFAVGPQGNDQTREGADVPDEAIGTLEEDESAGDAPPGTREELVEAAKERLLARMLEDYTPEIRAEIKRRAGEIRPLVRSVVEKEPVYRAIAEMQGNPDMRISRDEILSGWGDTALANMPEGVDSETGIPVNAAASALGWSGAEEFVDALVSAQDIEVEVERRAIEQAERDVATTDETNPDIEITTESGRSIESADLGELLLDGDGSPALGVIDTDTAQAAGIQPGEVYVNVGVVRHTETEHGEQIRAVGYSDATSMITDVLANYDEIRQGAGSSMLLVKRADVNALVAVGITVDEDGAYRGRTAWIARDKTIEKRKLLSSRSPRTSTSAPNSDPASLPGNPEEPQGDSQRWRARQKSNFSSTNITRDQGGVKDDINAATDALLNGDELLDRAIKEKLLMQNPEMAALLEASEQARAEQDNPLNRKKLVQFIRENGGLSLKKVKSGYGTQEAVDLVNRIGRQVGFWQTKDSARGLDEMADEMAHAGIPIESDRHLFEILISEDVSTLDPYEEIYQKGFADARAEQREKRREALKDEQTRKEWLRNYREELKTRKEVFKNAAQHIIGAQNSREGIKKSPYIQAAGKYRRLWDKAMGDRDMEAAAYYKDRETLNVAIATEATKTARAEDRMMHFLRKYANRANKQTFNVAPKYLAQIDATLARFDLRKRIPVRDIDKSIPVQPLDKFVEEMKAKGEPVLIPDRILDANFRTPWTKMTVDELRDLYDAVKNIEKLGQTENRTISGNRRVQVDLAAAEIAKNARKYYNVKGPRDIEPSPSAREGKNWLERMMKLPKRFLSTLETAESITRALDGYEDLGAAHRYIFQPIRDAVSRENKMLNDFFGVKLRDLLIRVYGTTNPGFMETRIEIDVLKRTPEYTYGSKNWNLRRDELIAFVLNLGNEGNRQRMADGHYVSIANLQKFVDAMSKQDLDFVQGLWDLLDTLRPMAGEVAETMTGVTPRWVEATPLVTKYGTYRGGYYHLKYDAEISTRAAQLEEEASLMDTIALRHITASTKSGYRKERAAKIVGQAPLLSLSVFDEQVKDVIHDIALAPALRDVNKIIHHPFVREAVRETIGNDKNNALNQWLRATAYNDRNNGIVQDSGDRMIVGFMKRGVVAMGLGLNMTGAILQTLGYFPLAGEIGLMRTVRAITAAAASPAETYKFALEKSDFMREQVSGQDKDLRKMIQKWSVMEKGGKLDAFRSFVISQYSFFQNLVNIPGWVESYKLGLRKFGGDDTKAVHYADSVIRQTQGNGSIVDLTTFETSGAWRSLFTMFYTWFRALHNKNTEVIRRLKNEPGGLHKLGIAMNHYVFWLLLPVLVERLIRDGGPDDDETWPKFLLKNALIAPLLAPLEGIPVVRDVKSAIEIGLTYRGRIKGYRFTPAAATAESFVNLAVKAGLAIGDAWEGEEPDWGKVAESAIETSGYFFGLPTRMAGRWLDAIRDWFADEDDFLAEAAKLILRGKRDEEKKETKKKRRRKKKKTATR